jgi:hypothetical protein
MTHLILLLELIHLGLQTNHRRPGDGQLLRDRVQHHRFDLGLVLILVLRDHHFHQLASHIFLDNVLILILQKIGKRTLQLFNSLFVQLVCLG